MLTFKCFWKMTKRDLVDASTRHHLARLLKYYPRRPCLIKSKIFPCTTNLLTFLLLKFLICIHAGSPRVAPRVRGQNPAGAIINFMPCFCRCRLFSFEACRKKMLSNLNLNSKLELKTYQKLIKMARNFLRLIFIDPLQLALF